MREHPLGTFVAPDERARLVAALEAPGPYAHQVLAAAMRQA